MAISTNGISPDHRFISGIVGQSSSVLDLGCGNGDLLYLLSREKNVRGQGIEIDDKAIFECVAKGLSVFHDDIDSGLVDYEDKSFDFVILTTVVLIHGAMMMASLRTRVIDRIGYNGLKTLCLELKKTGAFAKSHRLWRW